MGHPLDGALAKVGRAEEHLRAVKDEVRRWREEQRTSLSGDKNADRTEFRFYIEYERAPDPAAWALLIGDCVHNLRSALDHAVYECSGAKPPARCEFPIFLRKDRFFLPEKDESGGLYKVRGIKNKVVRALIEGAQPWQRADRPQDDHLWVIQQLDIEDKHHLLIPVGTVPREIKAEVLVELVKGGAPESGEIEIVERIPLENHALFFTIRTPEPAKRVTVNVTFTVGVGISVGDRMGGVTGMLRELCSHTRGLIEQIRDAFV